MSRITPYAPAILVVLGAILSTVGIFWASVRQFNFNSRLAAQSEEIARLQKENASLVTGGDSFCHMDFVIDRSISGNDPNDLSLTPIVLHKGKYPLYGVYARIVDIDQLKKGIQQNWKSHNLGDLPPGPASETSIRLAHYGRHVNYNIFYTARNGTWIQMFRMRWIDERVSTATRIIKEHDGEELYQQASPNFPRGANGEIDWDE